MPSQQISDASKLFLNSAVRAIGALGGAPTVMRVRAAALENGAVAHAARAWLSGTIKPSELRVTCASAKDTSLMRALAAASATRSPQPVTSHTEMVQRTSRIDRRVYVAYHPKTGSLPLAWAEAALRTSFPSTVEDVFKMDESIRPSESIAVFYSLAIANDAARGLGVARTLIKQAAALCAEEDGTRKFVTFSPIPDYRRSGGAPDRDSLLTYLHERRCAVGRFHRGNGATLRDVLWNADTSKRRMEESFGAVAVYEYVPSSLHRDAVHDG